MKWRHPAHHEARTRRRFAWWPYGATDGHTYWLTYVWEQQTYVQFYPGHGNWVTVGSWGEPSPSPETPTR